MERPKQQALAFLLGALLVGGVLGFSADRVLRKEEVVSTGRSKFYDDIGLQPAQRVAMDSLLDRRNCRVDSVYKTRQAAVDSVYKPLKPTVDSIKAATRAQMSLLLTPEQRVRLEARRKSNDAKHASDRAHTPSPCQK